MNPMTPINPIEQCPICSGNNFYFRTVLSQELINDWNISKSEVEYINYQQGFGCDDCKVSLRGLTLASAILQHFRFATMQEFLLSCEKKILEINEATGLTKFLNQLKSYTFVRYPEVDMQQMGFESNSFDVIIHSDTLEHIPHSVKALEECYRVLNDGGVLFYTIPIIHGRLTVKRHGMPKSYHGEYAKKLEDYVVYTEYGSDFYLEILEAGFKNITLHSISGKASLAIIAIK